MSNKVDDYIAGLPVWQASLASTLRRRVLGTGLEEIFKWGQPVYGNDRGPVCFLKSGKSHLLLGFWRGQQMADMDDRLFPFGSYRMAGIKLTGPDEIDAGLVTRLVEAGVSLNARHGDPLKEPRTT